MKAKLGLFFTFLCLPLLLQAADELTPPSAAVVRVLNDPLPHEEGQPRTDFLWNQFANKPDAEKFQSYGTENWPGTYEVFSKVLVQKATDLKLDAISLRKCLDLVLKTSEGKTAYLPVGAYQTSLDEKPVWIIVVNWEFPSDKIKAGLGHIRMFAYDQKTLKPVAFNTCM